MDLSGFLNADNLSDLNKSLIGENFSKKSTI